jgi:vinculin
VIGQIENLTPRIISASSEIRQQPQNSKHLQYLKTIQQEWRTHVGVLSDLSVDAVSGGDFLSTTEALAKESMTKCREALGELNFEKLTSEISLLVGISEKAVHVCRTESQRAADPLFKSRLTEVTSRVHSGRNVRLSHHAIPYCLSYHIISYHTIPYHTIPYHTIP